MIDPALVLVAVLALFLGLIGVIVYLARGDE